MFKEAVIDFKLYLKAELEDASSYYFIGKSYINLNNEHEAFHMPKNALLTNYHYIISVL